MAKTELLLEWGETILVAILTGASWSASLSFLILYSRTYWFVCGITTAYLILLLIKVVRKSFIYYMKEQDKIMKVKNA